MISITAIFQMTMFDRLDESGVAAAYRHLSEVQPPKNIDLVDYGF